MLERRRPFELDLGFAQTEPTQGVVCRTKSHPRSPTRVKVANMHAACPQCSGWVRQEAEAEAEACINAGKYM